MVTLNFKLMAIDSVDVDIAHPEPLEKVLQSCGVMGNIDSGAIMAIRKNMIVKKSDMVEDADIIDIFPAISGG